MTKTVSKNNSKRIYRTSTVQGYGSCGEEGKNLERHKLQEGN